MSDQIVETGYAIRLKSNHDFFLGSSYRSEGIPKIYSSPAKIYAALHTNWEIIKRSLLLRGEAFNKVNSADSDTLRDTFKQKCEIVKVNIRVEEIEVVPEI